MHLDYSWRSWSENKNQADEHNVGTGGTRVAFKIIWMMNHKLKCSSRQGHTRQDLSAGTVLITPEQPRDTHTNPLHKAILDIPIYVHLGTPARRWVSQGHACHQDLLQNLQHPNRFMWLILSLWFFFLPPIAFRHLILNWEFCNAPFVFTPQRC